MEFNVQDLSKEDLGKLKGVLLNVCRDYEPWADMMNLGGAGDAGADGFPFNIDEIERIDITVEGREGPQASLSGDAGTGAESRSGDAGTDAESQSTSSEETKKNAGAGVGLGVGVNVDVSGITETVGAVGGILTGKVKKVKGKAKKVKDSLL